MIVSCNVSLISYVVGSGLHPQLAVTANDISYSSESSPNRVCLW